MNTSFCIKLGLICFGKEKEKKKGKQIFLIVCLQALDLDGDGRISMRDFSAGFHSVGSTLLALSRRRRRQQLLESAQTQELETFLEKLDSDFDLFSR